MSKSLARSMSHIETPDSTTFSAAGMASILQGGRRVGVFSVSGNCQSGINILDGHQVLVELDTIPKWGQLAVVELTPACRKRFGFPDMPLLKVVCHQGHRVLLCVSNKNYHHLLVLADDVRVIGTVIGHVAADVIEQRWKPIVWQEHHADDSDGEPLSEENARLMREACMRGMNAPLPPGAFPITFVEEPDAGPRRGERAAEGTGRDELRPRRAKARPILGWLGLRSWFIEDVPRDLLGELSEMVRPGTVYEMPRAGLTAYPRPIDLPWTSRVVARVELSGELEPDGYGGVRASRVKVLWAVDATRDLWQFAAAVAYDQFNQATKFPRPNFPEKVWEALTARMEWLCGDTWIHRGWRDLPRVRRALERVLNKLQDTAPCSSVAVAAFALTDPDDPMSAVHDLRMGVRHIQCRRRCLHPPRSAADLRDGQIPPPSRAQVAADRKFNSQLEQVLLGLEPLSRHWAAINERTLKHRRYWDHELEHGRWS